MNGSPLNLPLICNDLALMRKSGPLVDSEFNQARSFSNDCSVHVDSHEQGSATLL